MSQTEIWIGRIRINLSKVNRLDFFCQNPSEFHAGRAENTAEDSQLVSKNSPRLEKVRQMFGRLLVLVGPVPENKVRTVGAHYLNHRECCCCAGLDCVPFCRVVDGERASEVESGFGSSTS